jgi:hypothetical protein
MYLILTKYPKTICMLRDKITDKDIKQYEQEGFKVIVL